MYRGVSDRSRNLVAEGLPSPGGHDHQRVHPTQVGLNRLALAGAELFMAEITLEGAFSFR